MDEAINAVSSGTPATIDLLRDCELYNTFTMGGKTITINLNGHTLTGNITLSGAADLTINGTGGTMVGSIICNNVGCSLTINGGTYKNTLGDAFLKVYNAKALNITAGEFFGGGEYALYMDTKQIVSSGIFVRRNITGGMFHGIYDTNSDKTLCRQDGYCFNVGDQKLKLSEVAANAKQVLTITQCTTHDYEDGKSCIYCGLAKQVEYVAQVGETKYEALTEALAAAADLGTATVTLLKNVTIDDNNGVYTQPGNTTLTIDLNGRVLDGAINVKSGASLTMTGSAEGSKVTGDIYCSGATLTITSGYYEKINGNGAKMLNISGGEVKYLIPGNDTDHTTGAYIRQNITGGTFHAIHSKTIVKYCLAEGYCFWENGNPVDLSSVTDKLGDTETYTTAYTVAPCTKHSFESDPTQEKCVYCDTLNSNNPAAGMVAMVGENYYKTFEAAVEEASKSNGTVKLIKDCAISNAVTVNSSITIDLNGKCVTTSGTKFKINGGKVTITSSTDTGRIYGDKGNAVTLSGGALTVNAGVVLQGYGGSTGYAVSVSGGDLILNQGVILLYGIKTTAGVGGIREYLASGTAFAEYDSATAAGSLVNGYTTKDYSGDLIVVEHTVHNYNDIGECPCGYICPHTEWNENGVCTVCEKTAAAALTVNGQTEFFMNAVAALDKAQSSSGEVTLKLLKTVRLNGRYIISCGTFTVDMNGYALGIPK